MTQGTNIDCVNLGENKSDCPCTATSCSNHGLCCKCVQNHREKGNYPACLRYESIRG